MRLPLLLSLLAPLTLGAQPCATEVPRDSLLARGCWFELRTAVAAAPARDPDRALHAGAAAHAFNRQDEAARLLRGWLAARGADPARRWQAARARETLAEVEATRGRYAAAAAQLDTLAASGGTLADWAPADTIAGGAVRRGARLWGALGAVPAQTVAGVPADAAARVAMRRDLAGLARLDATVNGRAQELVFDTGAGLSVAMASVADTLGLRLLPDTTYARASTGALVPARLAIADSLRVGPATLRHVVFLVFADRDLTFASGAYRIPAILGAPVITALQRIALLPGDTLAIGGAPARDAGEPTLAFGGTRIFARAAVDGQAATYVLDTGARQTVLYPAFATAHAARVAAGTATTFRSGGVGGMRDQAATRLDALPVAIAERTVTVPRVTVLGTAPTEGTRPYAGVLGQDVLRALGGVRLDFATMRLTTY